MVLARPDLSLIVETSGLSWTGAELEEVAAIPRPVQNRPWGAPAGRLSWIVSLDAADEARYAEVRGAGFAAATETARTLLRCFPGDTYVQALRIRGAEDDTERFYRRWKEIAGAERVIVQKYDDFAGALPKLQGADISPVRRRPCWHLLRDMNIFMDGRVPSCREDLAALDGGAVLGNAFEEDLAALWDRGKERYREHCSGEYRGLCADCDEYYTFNF
jgi:spiro-SPASM protein